MWLIHVGKNTISDKLNDYPPFVFPAGKPVEVKSDFLANAILEHRKLDGLVEVPIIVDDKGMSFDLPGAKKAALENLKKGRRELVMQYVKTQQEYRISVGKPPLPPSPVVQKIIEEEGIDLAAEGINLSGSGFKIANQDLGDRVATLEEQLATLLEQNKLLKEQNEMLKGKK
jgi:hypothetical protein